MNIYEETYYDVLEVKENASLDAIKGAYKFLSQKYHPDKSGVEGIGKQKKINAAFEVLSNEEKRRKYDRELKIYRMKNNYSVNDTDNSADKNKENSRSKEREYREKNASSNPTSSFENESSLGNFFVSFKKFSLLSMLVIIILMAVGFFMKFSMDYFSSVFDKHSDKNSSDNNIGISSKKSFSEENFITDSGEKNKLHSILEKAEGNDISSQLFLAGAFRNGDHGFAQNDQYALKWYQRAADFGNPEAQFYLGTAYLEGIGVIKNNDMAFSFFQKSAVQNFVLAQYNLALMYANVYDDLDEALFWIIKSASQGFAESQLALGKLYINGVGVEKDVQEGLFWLEKAAEGGIEEAHELISSYKKELKTIAAPQFDFSFLKQGNVTESCYHEPCSVLKFINFQIYENKQTTEVRLEVLGGERKWNSKKVIWNKKNHTITVICSLQQPTVVSAEAVTLIPLNPEYAPPGVIIESAELYLKTCHNFDGEITEGASQYGYKIFD